MTRKLLSFLLLLTFAICTMAQTKMRDIMAEAPDSIFPLMTKNDRLDCIDYFENGMQARVKNVIEDYVQLEALTDDYLRIKLSKASVMEMKLLVRQQDTVLYVARTFYGPVADSDITLYDLQWNVLPCPIERPSVDTFLPEDADPDARGFLRGLPLIKATLTPDAPTVTFDLQLDALTRQLRKPLSDKVHPITVELN